LKYGQATYSSCNQALCFPCQAEVPGADSLDNSETKAGIKEKPAGNGDGEDSTAAPKTEVPNSAAGAEESD